MLIVSIPLTQGKIAVIDECDYALVSPHRWHAVRAPNGVWYARARIDRRNIYMHRLITRNPPYPVDHRSGDGLDNRRENLREATQSQNLANREARGLSEFIGVWRDHHKQRWVAQVTKDRKRVFQSYSYDEETAARLRDEAARRIFGQFATFNFPREGERPARRSQQRNT